ncbi:MAG: hypothetical protein ACXVUL_08605 [Solirubrobacteraceae bacterium]
MDLSEAQRHDLDVALNEAALLGAEVDVERRSAALTFAEFEVDQLLDVVRRFTGQPVYGWEFLELSEADNFATWSDRLSLDWRSQLGGLSHTLDLFQEGYDRHLDLRNC